MRNATLFLVFLVACGSPPPPPAATYDGFEFIPAMPKPDFVLDDVSGTPLNFRSSTDGHLTLLFFGYTHCPDVCPVQLTNVAATLNGLTPEERNQVKVVFVTTDPDRDTPEQLKDWLSHFNIPIIGLRGPIDTVHRVERALGMPPSYVEQDTLIAHGARVYAFSPDDSLRILFSPLAMHEEWTKGVRYLLTRTKP